MAKYGKKAQEKVKKVMEERKKGTLKRKVREEGHEPETGNRDRAFRGATCGRKGAQKESLFQEKSVVWKENYFEEKALRPEEDVVQLVIAPAPLGSDSIRRAMVA